MVKDIKRTIVNDIINNEENVDDLIFNNMSNNSSIIKDTSYNKPDYSCYIFSTMQNTDVTAYTHSGILLPVRYKANLKNYKIYNMITKELGYETPEDGVYIIEYFNLYPSNAIHMHNIINYHMHSGNIVYSDVTLDEINKILTIDKRVMSEKRIRIITYVPDYVIKEEHYVHMEKSNITLGIGEISEDVINPNNPIADIRRNEHDAKKEKVKNVITIELVDNNSNTPKYITVGNEVFKIYPSKDSSSKNYCSVTNKMNNMIMSTHNVSIENANNIGLYDSKKEALSMGDTKHLIELEKTKLEYKKLENDRSKLIFEKEKLVHDKTKIENELEKLRLENIALKNKHQYEMLQTTTKAKLIGLDFEKKVSDMIVDADFRNFKLTMDLNKMLMDIKYADIMYERKVQSMDNDIMYKAINMFIK